MFGIKTPFHMWFELAKNVAFGHIGLSQLKIS